MAAKVERQLSTASQEGEDESLDPRVQVELEKLNKSSDDINKLELELDEARASFRQVLTESTQRLNALSKKLGSCIEKARPYYEARMKAKEAQIQTQNVALRFERACSQQMAAKEMVFLAEQGFFKKGQPFDPAWQEMLNHATMKVNDAERERLESEIAHQVTARIFNECEQRVKHLQKDLKRNIAKSRPYFEQKAKFNHTMEEQKRRVGVLEQAVADAKLMYSEALRNLERISDEIHQQRRDARLRQEMGARGSGVGAEEPAPPPHDDGGPAKEKVKGGHMVVNRTNSQTQTDSEMLKKDNNDNLQGATPHVEATVNGGLRDQCQGEAKVAGPLGGGTESKDNQTVINRRESAEEKQIKAPSQKASPVLKRASACAAAGAPPSLFKHGQGLPLSEKEKQYLTVEDTETVSETVSSTEMLTPGSGPSSVQTTAVTSPETEHEPEANVESTKTNMEIMETLQKAKNFKSPFLRPNRSRDNLLEEASDNESIPGSMASVSVLDDDQIESLMLETGDFVNFLSRQDEGEVERIKSMTLPAKLSYLQSYMHFRPEFIEGNNVGAEAMPSNDQESVDNDSVDNAEDPAGGDGQNVSEATESSELVREEPVMDSKDYDACWSCEIDQDDIPETQQKSPELSQSSNGKPPVKAESAPSQVFQSAQHNSRDAQRCSRGYSFEEDSEFQRVYRELSAFEKLMKNSSSSEDSPPPQSPPVTQQSSTKPSYEQEIQKDSVQITVTAAESSPECQKDPLGVMPMKAIAKVSASSEKSTASPSKTKPVEDNVEHFV